LIWTKKPDAALIDQTANKIVDAIQNSMSSEFASSFGALHQDRTFWEESTGQVGSGGITDAQRIEIVSTARRYVVVNPMARQGRNLWTNYGISNGIEYKPTDAAKDTADKFWTNPKNREIFSSAGQRRLSHMGVTDGELFYAFFGTGSDTLVRTVDALQVSEIAYAEGDACVPLWYVRKFRTSDGKESFILYPDFRNTDLEDGVTGNGFRISNKGQSVTKDKKDYTLDLVEGIYQTDEMTTNVRIKFNPNSRMYHWIFDGTGERGESVFTSSIDWIKAQQLFMRDRISIMRAIATFAKKIKFKGGQAIANTLKSFFGTSTTSTDGSETNPKIAAGSTFIGNDAFDMEAVNHDTGAQAAKTDGDMLVVMQGVGLGIFPQYYGAGNLQNYAQANTMEGPMFKQWQAYQENLKSMFKTIFFIALESGGLSGEDVVVGISMDEIIRRDTPAMLDAMTKVFGFFPELIQSEEIQRQLLDLFGMDNLDSIIEEVKEILKNAPAPIAPIEQPKEVPDEE